MKTDRRGWTRKTLDLLASWVWLAAVGVTVLETVGCAGVSTTPTPISVSVTISPILATVAAGGTQQFSAVVQNTSNTAVTWQVNGVTGGNATVGTISSSGLYTAPGVVPNPATVTVTAVSQADATKSASAQVTITAATGMAFYVSTTGSDSNPGSLSSPWRKIGRATSAEITWQVDGTTGGNAAVCTTSSSGLYTAPGVVPNPATVTVTAVSQADATKSASAQVTITAATGMAFYVSTTGSDSNPGSLSSPWRTIQRAANSVQAGDIVYVT